MKKHSIKFLIATGLLLAANPALAEDQTAPGADQAKPAIYCKGNEAYQFSYKPGSDSIGYMTINALLGDDKKKIVLISGYAVGAMGEPAVKTSPGSVSKGSWNGWCSKVVGSGKTIKQIAPFSTCSYNESSHNGYAGQSIGLCSITMSDGDYAAPLVSKDYVTKAECSAICNSEMAAN